MKPMATTHTVSTRHDLDLARAWVDFGNEVLRPTRKLQGLLAAACVVAVGFMFTPGPARYALWAAGALIALWNLIGDGVAARVRLLRDPSRGTTRSLEFAHLGFRPVDGTGGDQPWVPYDQVRSLHADDRFWILSLRSQELVILAVDGVDGGAVTPEAFTSYLENRTKLTVEPLKKTLAARVQRAQDGRRGYLDANPTWLTRTIQNRRNPE